jgi:hypothetical protein
MSEEKKKPSKKKSDEDKIAKARKKRLALAEERGLKKPEKDNSREEFRKYFLKLSKKLKLDKSLEEVIWVHLKTIGCNKKELFDKGVKHFGYKI